MGVEWLLIENEIKLVFPSSKIRDRWLVQTIFVGVNESESLFLTCLNIIFRIRGTLGRIGRKEVH